MVPPDVVSIFAGIAREDDQPDVVVISDIGDGFTHAALNRAFLMLRNGAELIALQRNQFWFYTDSVKLDCRAFVLALEAASKKKATVTASPHDRFLKSRWQVWPACATRS